MESYRDLFCRMCYQYDCKMHGIEHPLPLRRVDPTSDPPPTCSDSDLPPPPQYVPVVVCGALTVITVPISAAKCFVGMVEWCVCTIMAVFVVTYNR